MPSPHPAQLQWWHVYWPPGSTATKAMPARPVLSPGKGGGGRCTTGHGVELGHFRNGFHIIVSLRCYVRCWAERLEVRRRLSLSREAAWHLLLRVSGFIAGSLRGVVSTTNPTSEQLPAAAQ